MALNKSGFEITLRTYIDPGYSGSTEFPKEEADFINALSDAVEAMTSSIQPGSGTASAALGVMKSTLLGVNTPDSAIGKIQDAFTAYAGVLASGMLGQNHGGGTVSISVPPNGKIQIASLENIGLNEGSAEDVVKEFSAIAADWFKTGTTTIMIGNSVSTGPNWS